MIEKPTYEELEQRVKELQKAADVCKRIEKVFQALDQEKESILNSLVEHVIHQDSDMRIIWANQAACKSMNLTYEGIVGRYCYEVWPQRSDPCPDCPVLKAMETRQPQEIEKSTPDGRSWLIRGYPEIDKKGDIVGGIEITLEVTERKQAEEALRESEKRFRELADSLPQIIFETDEKGKLTFVNKNAFRVFGYNQDEFDKGLNALEMIIPAELAKASRNMLSVMSGKILGAAEYTAIRKDGTTFPMMIHSSPITRDDKVEGLRGIIIDLTEQKKMEARLQQAKKMEAIGALAGGVAHDLNNILSGLVSYPELLLMDIPVDSPLRKPILTIQRSGQKAATIVQDLLTLARRGVSVTEVINLNQIISDYLNSPEHEKLISFHSGIELKADFEKELFNIMGSPVHLSKIVMNLVSNAAEAMSDGGKIVISTANRYIDRPIGGYDYVEEGDYVTLTVSDTGAGISPDDIEKIFEPFYTKKVMGRSGTGLGMAVVWSTVKDHKGYLDVQSTIGKGTTCTLYFPVTRKESPKDSLLITIEDYMGKGESILVVDDVAEQREIASEMLNKLGYSVVSVSSGEEAVEYMKTNSMELVVLDMIMDPGIDGLETYKRILRSHSGQKAIIASGYSETERVKEAQKLGAGRYIKKPYTLEKLGIPVRDELKR